MALPGAGFNFDQFQTDDVSCQAYASQASGRSAEQSAQQSAVDSAVVGTIVGAAAGALIGSASGNAGAGAAIGGGSGLLLGSAAGTDAYGVGGSRAQNRYDSAYVQCMYGRGHRVPVPMSVAAANQAQPATAYVAPTPPRIGAYPPPGTRPPPGY